MGKVLRRLKYGLWGYMKVEMVCPHGKFWPGNYRAGQDTNWGCEDCPMKMNIRWSFKKDYKP